MKVYYKDLAIDCPDSNVAIYVFKELFKFIYGGEPKPEANIPANYDVNISLTGSTHDKSKPETDPTKETSLL